MNIFHFLPSEVLRIITSYISGLYIGRLYLCGNTALNHKLLNQRGVDTFRLYFSPHSPGFTLPLLASRFPFLVDFSFEVDPLLPNHSISGAEVSSLPTTLLKLSIKLHGFTALSSLLSPSQHPSWITKFPNLVTLELSTGVAQPNWALESSTDFPPLLTKLQFPSIRSTRIRDLPRGLLTLISCVSDDSPEVDALANDPLFPPSLETLHLTAVSYASFMQWLSNLHKLRHLLLDWTPLMVSNRNFPGIWNFCGWEKLPTLLVSLRTASNRVSKESIKLLPRSLTSLELKTSSTPIPYQAMRHLPKKLTRLDAPIQTDPLSLSEVLRSLPRGLTSLPRSASGPFLSEDQLLAIPRSVRSQIEVTASDPRVPNLLLPPMLNSLVLSLPHPHIYEDVTLSPSITHLALQCKTPKSCLAHFWPAKLRSLVLSQCTQADVLSSVPSSLETLYVKFVNGDDPKPGMEHLPRLTKLCAMFAGNDSAPIEWIRSVSGSSLEVIKMGSTTVNWDADLLSEMQKFEKLNTMEISSIVNCSSHHIGTLPRTLTAISLHGISYYEEKCHTLTESVFGLLPKRLISLTLSPPTITQPKNIQQLLPLLLSMSFGDWRPSEDWDI